MKVLLLSHPDMIPPEDVEESKVDWYKVPWEAEYDVSKTLKKIEHKVIHLGVESDLHKIRTAIFEHKPNIVFNLLEEFNNEAIFDQNVVSYLELLNMPYTGCNPRGLMIARDKALAKKILTFHRIRVPKFQVFPRNRPNTKIRINRFPLIVKCVNEEASLGISQASVVHSNEKLKERIDFLFEKYSIDVIAEEFIEGREYYMGVLGNYRLQTFPPMELQFKESDAPEKEFYSQSAKFNKNYRKRKGINTVLAKIEPDLEKEMSRIAKNIFRKLNLSGYARMDFRVTQDGKIYTLEANPNPDIAMEEDFALSAKAVGISYEKLLEKIIKLGKQWNPT